MGLGGQLNASFYGKTYFLVMQTLTGTRFEMKARLAAENNEVGAEREVLTLSYNLYIRPRLKTALCYRCKS